MRCADKARSLAGHALVAAALAFLVSLTGCIRVEQVLTLNADGSGTIDLTYGMSEESVRSFQEMSEDMAAGSNDLSEAAMPFDFSDEDIRNDFKDYEEDGVALESVSTSVRDGWKYRRMVIAFRNLEGLARSGFLADRRFSLTRDAQGNYVLVQASGGNGEMAGQLSALGGPEMQEVMSAMMKGFRAVIRIRTPGRILETNAPEKDDRTASWSFDLEKDAQALEKAQAAAMRIVFEGKGLKIPEFKSGAAAAR